MKGYVVRMKYVSMGQETTTVSVRMATISTKTLKDVTVSHLFWNACMYHITSFVILNFLKLNLQLLLALNALLGPAIEVPVKEVIACYPQDIAEDLIEINQQVRQILREMLRMIGVIDGSGSSDDK